MRRSRNTDFAMELIPVTQKATNVCAYCRVRKQRCDRTLPSCERCAGKGRFCDYTLYKEPPRLENHETDTLVVHYNSCSHADLSSRGVTELLHAITACIDNPTDPVPISSLTGLVQELLDLADVNLQIALEEFGPCIQHWCSILFNDTLRGGANDLSQHLNDPSAISMPLLWLCLWLVMRRTCPSQLHVSGSELYRTMKQIVALSQTQNELHLEVFQISMIIAVYEFGHGLQIQTHQTLGSSITMLRLLDVHGKRLGNTNLQDAIGWMKVSTLMLDRLIPTSMIRNPIEVGISSANSVSRTISEAMGPTLPPQSIHPYASSTRKVYVRAAVSLAAGHVQEYIHAREQDLDPAESYDQVDAIINACIRQLLERPEPHLWQNCHATAMAFCSHLLLQASQAQYLRTILPRLDRSVVANTAYDKAQLALQFSLRMTWDMVRSTMGKIRSEAEIPHLPFAKLCSVFRGGLAVLEARNYVEENIVKEDEVQSFQQKLTWFAGRWGMGYQYLQRLEELLGQSESLGPESPRS